jgi:lysyl-tRNA synthetase class 2
MATNSTVGPSTTWDRIQSGQLSVRPRLVREVVVDATRSFFKRHGFREVETPLFVRHPGMEPHLDAFATTWRTATGVEHAGFLTTSPEYAMKKLLAAGVAPIFQICKSFRNGETVSARHNPEFTILEWYRANAGYETLMRDCEGLFSEIALAVRDSQLAPGSPHPSPLLWGERTGQWTYQGQTIDLTPPWERLTVREAFARYADLDVRASGAGLLDAARAKGYAVTADTTWEQAFHQIFLNEIEPRLGRERPTFLTEYPIALAALARAKPDDPSVAERFELYVAGIELANAFGELTDPVEQLRRLREEQRERRQLGKTVYAIDHDFIRALERGLPPSAGIALGVDRLAMFFADVTSIGEVLWFSADELFQE